MYAIRSYYGVHTAVCLLRRTDRYVDAAVDTTRVTFRPLTPEEIRIV